jgi:hypothetical protein
MSSYRLYAAVTAQLLSTHRRYDAALDAADEHTLAMLANADGWVTVETWIVGLGVDGPLTVHPVVSHIGPPDDLDICRRWLAEVRCRARREAL